MQTHGGTDAEKAILSSEREIAISLRADWNRNGQFNHELSDLTHFVSNAKTDRALSGSTPAEILLVEGSAAAELTATLGGTHKGMSLATLFSPFNTMSPLYGFPLVGVDVEYDIIVSSPLGEFTYPQFRGFVRTTEPNRADNSLTLTALDRAEVLRKPVQLPPWAVSEEHLNYGEVSSLSIYSSWVIDHCLRLCDVATTPYRPTFWEELNVPDFGMDGVQFWVTGNGGWLPTIGWLDNMNADTFANEGHDMYVGTAPAHPGTAGYTGLRPLGLNGLGDGISDVRRPNSEGYIHYWSLSRDKINPTACHYMGLTINTALGPNLATMEETPLLEVVIGGFYYHYILIENGQVWTRRRYSPTGDPEDVVDVESDKITIPAGQCIDVHVAWDNTDDDQSGTRAWIGCRVSGSSSWDVQTTWEKIAPGVENAPLYDHLKGRVRIGQAVGMSDIFYATRNAFGPLVTQQFLEDSSIRSAKYPAILDIGGNRLGFMPFREARDAWDIITDVAGAEFGSVFFDENGVFLFWNWDTMLDKQEEPVRTLTLDQIDGLNLVSSLDSVRNIITIQAAKKRAVYGNVYASDDADEFYVPAGETATFRVFVDNVLSPLPFRMGEDDKGDNQYRFEGVGTAHFTVWDDESQLNDHGYVLSFWNEDEGWWEEESRTNGNMSVDQYFDGDGFLTVKIWNNWGQPIRLATSKKAIDPANSGADEDGYVVGPGDSPAYHMGGTYIKDYDKVSVFSRDRDSMVKYGPRNLEFDGDWYHDTTVSASVSLIDKMRRRTEEPRPSTDAITIAGDPRLQMGDALVISDPDGFGDDMTMQILGISREWDINAGLTDGLTVEMYYVVLDDPPSDVDAGADVTEWVLEETLTRVGTYDPGDGTVSTQWEIIGGTSDVGLTMPGDTLTATPHGAGSWTFQFTATSQFGSDSDSFDLTTVGADPGGGGGDPSSPADSLWIGFADGMNHYNVGIGQPGGGTNHEDYEIDVLEEGFDDSPWFTLTDEGNVQFQMNVEYGRTSEGTSYARSELREKNEAGTSNASWNSGSGFHYMEGRSRITHVATTGTKPWVCFFQCHDASSDLVRVQLEGSDQNSLSIRVRWSEPGEDEATATIRSSYTLGTWVDWRMEFEDGECRIFLDGVDATPSALRSANMGTSGCYFKTGCYNQCSDASDKGNADPGDYFSVEVAKGSLVTWHTGYPTPTTPDWSGGGGGDTGGFRRLYMVNETPEFIPGVTNGAFWDAQRSDSLTNPRSLVANPGGSEETSVTGSDEVSTNPLDGLIRQFVSEPADASGTLSGQVRVCVGASENNTSANMYVRVLFWVLSADGTTQVGSGYQMVSENEITTTPTGKGFQVDLDLEAFSISFSEGDYLIVEVGFRATNSSSTPYTYAMFYGGSVGEDMWQDDTDMSLPTWFDYQTTGGSFGGIGGGGIITLGDQSL